jgi:hypothetical protein
VVGVPVAGRLVAGGAVDRVGGGDGGEGSEEDPHSCLVIPFAADGSSPVACLSQRSAGGGQLAAQPAHSARPGRGAAPQGGQLTGEPLPLRPRPTELLILVAVALVGLAEALLERSLPAAVVTGQSGPDQHGRAQ